MPRDDVVVLLWGDVEAGAARNRLRQLLFFLRRTLGAAAAKLVAVDGDALSLGPAVQVDVVDFERLLRGADPASLTAAVDLYRGEFLQGLAVETPTFEDWLRAERDRLRDLLVGALRRLAAHHAAAGNPDAAVGYAQRLLAVDPLDEGAHRQVMQLYADQGRHAEAFRQYQLCVEILRRELGVDPDEATRVLYRRLLARRTPTAHAQARRPAWPPAETPIVGREAELSRLAQALAATLRARGQVVAILGEAGIGKSRLVGELAADAERQGGQVIVGACHEAERTLPLQPWAEAVRSGGVLDAGEEVETLPRTWRLELARLFPELEPGAAPSPPAEESALQLFEAFTRILLGVARERPLVVILEDLHWSDDMSLRFLSFLSRRIDRARVLVAFTARDEEAVDLPALTALVGRMDREGRLRRLALAPLDRRQTDGLVGRLVPRETDAAVVASLSESVWTAGQGNPFVTFEAVQAWRDGALADGALPRRVHDLIAGRLDRLSAPAQHMMAIAAVMAGELDFALLARAADLSEAAAAETLEEVVRRRVVHGVGERFRFVHERIRVVAYERLLPPRRRLLHQRVAEAAELLHAGNLDPHAAMLGHHYWKAEAWDRAVEYLRRAGMRAFLRGGHREAAALLEQAIAALDRLPGTDDTRRLGVDLRFDLRFALMPLAEFETFGPHLHVAETLAAEARDQTRLGRVTAFLGNYYWWMGEASRSEAYCQRALAMARETGDVALETSARAYLGLVHYAAGRFTDGAALFRPIFTTGRDGTARERVAIGGLTTVYTGCYLSMCLAELGEFDEGYGVADSTIALATQIRHPFALAHACVAQCSLAARRGDLDRVLAAERWYRSVQDSTAEVWPLADWWIAYGRIQAGDAATALPVLEAVGEGAKAVDASGAGLRTARPAAITWVGEAYALVGRNQEAVFMAARSLELARAQSACGDEAWALRLQGDLAAHATPPDVDGAERSYRAALVITRACGMRPAEAHCLFGLGRLHARIGRVADARDALTASQSLFAALGMERWRSVVDAALREIDVATTRA